MKTRNTINYWYLDVTYIIQKDLIATIIMDVSLIFENVYYEFFSET